MYVQVREHPSGQFFATVYAIAPTEGDVDLIWFQLLPEYETAQLAEAAAVHAATIQDDVPFQFGDEVTVDPPNA